MDYWRIYCTTENAWTTGWSAVKPTTCFSNPVHTVNSESQSIVSDAVLRDGSDTVLIENDISNLHNLQLTGVVQMTNNAEPATPAAGTGILYAANTSIMWKSTATTDLTLGSQFVTSITQFDNAGPFSTTAQTYTQVLRMNTVSIPSGFYRICWCFNWNSSTTQPSNIRVQLDDSVTLNEYILSPSAVSDGQKNPISGFKYVNITTGSHYFDFDITSGSSNKTVTISDVRLEFVRIVQ